MEVPPDRQESPLAEHLTPRLDEVRLGRQWAAITERLAPRRAHAWGWVAGGVAAAALVAAVGVGLHRRAEPSASGTGTGTGTSNTIALGDGSVVTVEAGAKLKVDRAEAAVVHLVLESGAIELEVTHREREQRSFVVTAGAYDVTVVGTHFRVERAPNGGPLTVEVTRGLVRVDGPAGSRSVGAGERWTTVSPEASSEAPPAQANANALEEPTPSSAPAAPSAAGLPNGSGAPLEGPRELLSRASDARAAGKYRDAARALDTIRRRYRGDPRAGLAAFELGRLRLDTLGDPAGASEAFADAVALAPEAPFREDAEARRVEALEVAGNLAACARARDAYLARFPSGIHARRVSSRCRTP
jgi:acyl-coenzyme A thioesterase PaaI-like protein